MYPVSCLHHVHDLVSRQTNQPQCALKQWKDCQFFKSKRDLRKGVLGQLCLQNVHMFYCIPDFC